MNAAKTGKNEQAIAINPSRVSGESKQGGGTKRT